MQVTSESVAACNKSIDEAEKIIHNVIKSFEKRLADETALYKSLDRDVVYNMTRGVYPADELTRMHSAYVRIKTLEKTIFELKTLERIKFERIKPVDVQVSFGRSDGFVAEISL